MLFENTSAFLATTTYFFNAPSHFPYVVPLCPIVPYPELPHQSYAAPVPLPATAATAAAVNCSCGQCAPHMYNSHHLTAPSTLIVNRFTEINYFDNPPSITNLADKYDYDMVSELATLLFVNLLIYIFLIEFKLHGFFSFRCSISSPNLQRC